MIPVELFQSINNRNPMGFVQMMARSNPQAARVLQMCEGKSSAQLEEIARNLAANNGTNIGSVARSLGIQIPSNR